MSFGPPVRAVVRQEPWLDRILVYLLRQQGEGLSAAAFVEAYVGDKITGGITWRTYGEGSVPVPLLSLRPNEVEALAAALNEYVPIPGGDEALRDTRQVRDRLLTLVENLTTERSA